jgi:hypothetical protein
MRPADNGVELVARGYREVSRASRPGLTKAGNVPRHRPTPKPRAEEGGLPFRSARGDNVRCLAAEPSGPWPSTHGLHTETLAIRQEKAIHEERVIHQDNLDLRQLSAAR